jgi:hypothetical protein
MALPGGVPGGVLLGASRRTASVTGGASGDIGDERWNVFLAALAEHLAARDGRGAPEWATFQPLHRLWFPFNTRAARVDALVHAPAAFRRRGIYVAAQELDVA